MVAIPEDTTASAIFPNLLNSVKLAVIWKVFPSPQEYPEKMFGFHFYSHLGNGFIDLPLFRRELLDTVFNDVVIVHLFQRHTFNSRNVINQLL